MKEKLVAKVMGFLPECVKSNGGIIASGAGVVMLVAGGIWTAKKAHKLEEIHVEHLENRDFMKESVEKGEVDLTDEDGGIVPYTPKDYRHDVAWDYGHEVLDYGKCLAGPILLQLCGAGAVMSSAFVSKNTIVKLNTDLAKAAITIEGLNKTVDGLSRYINRYRKNVIEDQGIDADRRYRMGIVNQEYEETITQKNGKEKTVTKVKQTIDPCRAVAGDYAIPLKYTNIWHVASRYDYNNPAQRALILDAVMSKQNYMQILYDASGTDGGGKELDMMRVYHELDCEDWLTEWQKVLGKNAGWMEDTNESEHEIIISLIEVGGELYLDFNCWGGMLLRQQAKCGVFMKPYTARV